MDFKKQRDLAIIKMCSERGSEIKASELELDNMAKEIGKLIAERDFLDAMGMDQDSNYTQLCNKISILTADYATELENFKEKKKLLEKEMATLTYLLDEK